MPLSRSAGVRPRSARSALALRAVSTTGSGDDTGPRPARTPRSRMGRAIDSVTAFDLPDGSLTATSSSGPVGAQWADRETLTLFARVDDPEGVREVAIWGTTKLTCVPASGLATTRGPGLVTAPLTVSTDDAKAGEMTRTAREVEWTIQAGDFRCPARSQLIAEQVFWGAGSNFGAATLRVRPLPSPTFDRVTLSAVGRLALTPSRAMERSTRQSSSPIRSRTDRPCSRCSRLVVLPKAEGHPT